MTIAELDAEISRLKQQVSAVERAPRPFDEVWPAVEAELAEAEAVFRRVGPRLSGFISPLPEHADERHRAMVGMALLANKKAIIDSERSRVRAATEGGLSGADRQRRIAQLRTAILRDAAQKEIALRSIEREGDFQPRPVHPELLVYKHSELERLAR